MEQIKFPLSLKGQPVLGEVHKFVFWMYFKNLELQKIYIETDLVYW